MNQIGRITIYSIAGCPHCLAAKKRLKTENLQYFDVGVDRLGLLDSKLCFNLNQTDGANAKLTDKFLRLLVTDSFSDRSYHQKEQGSVSRPVTSTGPVNWGVVYQALGSKRVFLHNINPNSNLKIDNLSSHYSFYTRHVGQKLLCLFTKNL